jgi:hypothetical protein
MTSSRFLGKELVKHPITERIRVGYSETVSIYDGGPPCRRRLSVSVRGPVVAVDLIESNHIRRTLEHPGGVQGGIWVEAEGDLEVAGGVLDRGRRADGIRIGYCR